MHDGSVIELHRPLLAVRNCDRARESREARQGEPIHRTGAHARSGQQTQQRGTFALFRLRTTHAVRAYRDRCVKAFLLNPPQQTSLVEIGDGCTQAAGEAGDRQILAGMLKRGTQPLQKLFFLRDSESAFSIPQIPVGRLLDDGVSNPFVWLVHTSSWSIRLRQRAMACTSSLRTMVFEMLRRSAIS